MTFLEFCSYFGGAGTIVCSGIVYLLKNHADRKIEELSKKLERKLYVSKVRFDAEFEACEKIMSQLDKLLNTTELLFLFGIDRVLGNKTEQEKDSILRERYQNACDAYQSSKTILETNSILIPTKIYDMILEFNCDCCDQIKAFEDHSKTGTHDDYVNTGKLKEEYKKIQAELRKHFEEMD